MHFISRIGIRDVDGLNNIYLEFNMFNNAIIMGFAYTRLIDSVHLFADVRNSNESLSIRQTFSLSNLYILNRTEHLLNCE